MNKERIIKQDRSIIISADIESNKLEQLIFATSQIEGVGGYKIGLTPVLEKGLVGTVEIFRDLTNLPLIYDHQKAGNDIPSMGCKFAEVCKKSGVDAVILFPFTGPQVEKDWIRACLDKDLRVIVGAHMTHSKFLYSEGGYIEDSTPLEIFTSAIEEGVRDFVVPGNKLEILRSYVTFFNDSLGKDNYTLYAPGFITQGGQIPQFALLAGNRWHAIVGGAIYEANNILRATKNITKSIL